MTPLHVVELLAWPAVAPPHLVELCPCGSVAGGVHQAALLAWPTVALLHVDELGREKCVACFLCAAACPSECIYIVAKDDPRIPEERVGVDERYAEVYNIDYGRCIFCGYCVEACPKDAITHGYNFELSVYNRADLLKTKDDLLITKQVQSRNYRVASSTEDVDSEYKEV